MFILNNPKADGPTIVMLLYPCNDGRLKISTSEKCHPTYWQPETERAKGKFAFINQTLEKISRHIAKAEESRRISGTPILKINLKADLLKIMGKNEGVLKNGRDIDFWEYIDKFIFERESGRVLTPANKQFAKETIKHYRHSRDNLMRYQAATGDNLSFHSITLATRANIIAYFHQHYNHSTNSIGVTIKHLKVFLKEAAREGVHTNRIFEHKDFKVPAENTFDVYLTEAELQALEALQPQNGHLMARDWFLVECYTGLRISDAKRLKPANLHGGKITISNEKTDERVVIPIHPVIGRIISRWQGFPPAISEQKINKYVKELAKQAGITEQVLYTVTQGGSRKDYYLPKCEMISNHTGRRSFISNLIRNKVPDQIIMQLAGIRKAATLEKYNKLTKEEIADVAAQLPFFKG
jgi:integrase